MSVTTVACKRCGTVAASGADRCDKCKCALLGNALAVTHGGRRRRALTAREARGSELYARWATDLGGEDSLTVGQQEVLAGTVAAVFIRQTAERYLATAKTPLTSERALRALEVFFKAAADVRRGADMLGIERKTKTVPDLAAAFHHEEERR